MQKYVPLVKQNVMKLKVVILGGHIFDKKSKKGWWRGRRERIEKGSRERIEIERQKGTEEEDKEHRHLPLLVASRHCVSPEFPTRFCSKAVKYYY